MTLLHKPQNMHIYFFFVTNGILFVQDKWHSTLDPVTIKICKISAALFLHHLPHARVVLIAIILIIFMKPTYAASKYLCSLCDTQFQRWRLRILSSRTCCCAVRRNLSTFRNLLLFYPQFKCVVSQNRLLFVVVFMLHIAVYVELV
jgi:hypothetical protein